MLIDVDVTPSLVNRTAIYRIVKDVCGDWIRRAQGAKELDLRFVAMGLELKGLQGEPFRRKVALKWFQWVVRFPLLFLALKETVLRVWWASLPKGFGGSDRTLFLFDPLYALFYSDSRLNNAWVTVLDLTPISHPDWHPGGVALLYRAAFQKLVGSRARFICISQSTADDLRGNYGVSASSIEVVPIYLPNFDACPTPPKSQDVDNISKILQDKFVLFVGSLEHRKNIVGLLEGFDQSGVSEEGVHLVIVGGRGNGWEHVDWKARQTRNVNLLGYVDDSTLSLLYEHAMGFVYPSYWEGFGVPLLEAMARGLVCVSTETGASPEVGRNAVLYADPTSTRSIAQAIRKLVDLPAGERQRRIELGRQISSEYSLESYLKSLARVVFGERSSAS